MLNLVIKSVVVLVMLIAVSSCAENKCDLAYRNSTFSEHYPSVCEEFEWHVKDNRPLLTHLRISILHCHNMSKLSTSKSVNYCLLNYSEYKCREMSLKEMAVEYNTQCKN